MRDASQTTYTVTTDVDTTIALTFTFSAAVTGLTIDNITLVSIAKPVIESSGKET
jgi:hypothetical protein